MNVEARLEELWSKVSAFTERVAARYPGALACGPGCADCCRRELTVTAVEAARIRREVESLGEAERARLAARAEGAAPCVALGEDGRCAIYAVRPVVCRSHGLPLRLEEPAGLEEEAGGGAPRRLPVVDACPKNFTELDLGAIEASCVLDQRTLSVLLGAIDAMYADQAGEPRGVRHPLREVVLAAAGACAP